MARRARLDLPGIPQHVIQRGINRTACFFADVDYTAYLQFLDLARKKADCSIHAYVLMTNHVHLLVTGNRAGSTSVMMQSLGRRYVRYVNDQHRRTGSLWEGRYRSTLIDSERYLLACYRYIELNPVRSGIVGSPADYPWSSFGHHVNVRTDPLIEDHEVFFGVDRNAQHRADIYRDLCQSGLEVSTIEEIRRKTNRGYVLGSARFARQIAAKSGRRVTEGKPGRPRAG
jgi:putative transposase